MQFAHVAVTRNREQDDMQPMNPREVNLNG